MTYNFEIIGKQMKKARNEKKYTLSNVADACGLEQYQTVSNWEKGNTIPSLDKLLKLCELYGCELGYLLGEKGYELKTRTATDIKRETGLSEQAISSLSYYKEHPLLSQSADFYSAFISNAEISGMLTYLPGLINQIENNGLTEKENAIFQNKNEALDFYNFQMTQVIMKFIKSYFEEQEFIY